jgi:hypothetical protein
VFCIDVAKVNQDVAMVVYVCCKLLFPMFYLFFPYVCCKCVYLDVAYVTHMLQVFYLDVVYVLQWFSCVFANVSDACFKCFVYLQTCVGCFKIRSGVASPSLLSAALPRCLILLLASACIYRPLPLFSMLVTFEVARALPGRVKRCGKRLQVQASGRPFLPDVRTLVSLFS